MPYVLEKDAKVTHAELSSKTKLRPVVGFAAFRVLLSGLVAAIALVPFVAAGPASAAGASPFGSSLASPAFAAAPPQIIGELWEEEVFATRAHIAATVKTGGVEIEWEGEFATNPSGPWTLAGSGTSASVGQPSPPEQQAHIALGAIDEDFSLDPRYAQLHHLTPNTLYYVRFKVKNESGAAERTLEFKTRPVGKPEIAHGVGGGPSIFNKGGSSRTGQSFMAQLESDGAETKYHFEYALSENGNPPAKGSPSWKSFTSGASGIVTVAEDFAELEASVTGLSPETSYYARLRASNEQGEIEEVRPFTTLTARPTAEEPSVRNVTGNSVHIEANLVPAGSETSWRFEYATSAEGPWLPVAGAEGTVSQAEAEALPVSAAGNPTPADGVEGTLTGLRPATTYYVRLFAQNKVGEGRNGYGEPILSEARGLANFTTSGPPTVTTLAVHALHGEVVRLLGAVAPHAGITSAEQTIAIGGPPTGGTFTLTFKGQTTAPIAFDAPAEGPGSVADALKALSIVDEGIGVYVFGHDGGPYTVSFGGSLAGKFEPQITADASGLTPTGTASVTVTVDQAGGEGYDTRYHFEYVTQEQFEKPGGEGGFAASISTPEVDLGSGDGGTYMGQDLPGLRAGQTYRYRLVATSTLPAVVDGEAQSLTVPAPAAAREAAACPNAQSRTGASANLPDCRAYEQLTPVDKEGAQELFNYGPTVESGVLVGEDGTRAVAADPVVNWGAGPGAGQSPYFFSRDSALGWQMTAAAPQPETGVQRIVPELFDGDLTEFAFEADVYTSRGSGESKEVEFKVGPPGGPYKLVATVPRNQAEGAGLHHGGWVAASDDFSKLILALDDPTLLGSDTGTRSGNDLYEYSGGRLSQANVGIGACGAQIARGDEQRGESYANEGSSSSHAVSADGSRVFFEATPGNDCSAAEHLYMRENGTETVDLGEYSFAGANAQGTMLLLENKGKELFLYNPESAAAPKSIFSGETFDVVVSQEFKAVYFRDTNGSLYRYDVPDEKLRLLFLDYQGEEGEASPDGRFYYFQGGVSGVPGSNQAFLYDSVENVVECVSCASPSDPEPKFASYVPNQDDTGQLPVVDGHPSKMFFSANGEYAFFDTVAALVPSDVDGEVAPELAPGSEHQSEEFSPSSDVYEWRRDGVDGCVQLQGCLALITNGRGGYLNLLLGTTPSGEDVLIYTGSELLPQDNDTAGDVYDARVDGGLPGPAPHPTECEAAECSTPASAPNDATPASSTFTGPGDVVGQSSPKPVVVKSKKPKAKKKGKRKKRKVRKLVRVRRSAKGSSRGGKR